MLKELVDKKEKKVEYIELIYDLIFVYIIGRNNALLHNLKDGFVETGFFLSYIFCTLAVIQIWTFTTYYINVYGKKGVREHIFLFVNMFLLYFLAQGIGSDWQALHNQFHIAWALILLNIAVQYAIELRHHKEIYHQKRIKHMVAVLVSEAAIVLLCILEFEKRGSTMLSFAAVIFGILFVLVASRNSCSALVDFNHLSERAMLYVVFTFGEMIIAIASYFEGDFNLNSLYFSLLAFAIVVGLFLSYGVFYDHILDHEKQTNGIGYILIHIFIIFALNNITVALEFMRNEQVHILPKIAMMLGSMLLYFAFLFAAGIYAKKRAKPQLKTALIFALICGAFVALMLVFRENMYINIAISVVFVYVMFLFIFHFKKTHIDGQKKLFTTKVSPRNELVYVVQTVQKGATQGRILN